MSTTTNAPAPAPPAPPAPPDPATRGRGKAFIIFFLILLIAGGVGLYFWLQSRQFESTDDAQVEAHLNSISSRVDGSITAVYVDNNQIVKAGDPLVDLDPRDFQVIAGSGPRSSGASPQPGGGAAAQRPHHRSGEQHEYHRRRSRRRQCGSGGGSCRTRSRICRWRVWLKRRPTPPRRRLTWRATRCSSRTRKFRSRSSIRWQLPPRLRRPPWPQIARPLNPPAAPWSSGRPSWRK